MASQARTHPAVQQTQDKAQYYVAQLDKELTKYPIFHQFEAKTGVPKAYGAIGGSAVLFILLFINITASPISNLIGWIIPAYLSIQALETPGHEDDVQWLTYWVTFGFLNFLESLALSLVLYYFPFYFVFKTIFVVWLQAPATKGARTLYTSVLRPVFANASAKANQYPATSQTTTSYTTTSFPATSSAPVDPIKPVTATE